MSTAQSASCWMLLLLLLVVTCSSAQQTMRVYHQTYGSSRLSYHIGRSSHQVAADTCRKEGGALVRIESEQKQKAIVDFLYRGIGILPELRWASYLDAGYWVGASDGGQRKEWRWSDGRSVATGFRNWFTAVQGMTQPDGAGDVTSCMFISARPRFYRYAVAGTWFDAPCTDRKYFICERAVAQPVLADPTPGWYKWSGWSGCSATCGSSGQHTRFRRCRSMVLACAGDATQQKTCSPLPQC